MARRRQADQPLTGALLVIASFTQHRRDRGKPGMALHRKHQTQRGRSTDTKQRIRSSLITYRSLQPVSVQSPSVLHVLSRYVPRLLRNEAGLLLSLVGVHSQRQSQCGVKRSPVREAPVQRRCQSNYSVEIGLVHTYWQLSSLAQPYFTLIESSDRR